uniref:Potassium/proton antiporter CemA n=1 Tax=Sphagnum aongstroemii TaxID=128180 RepID=A0A172N6Q1_9BRYO|nr:chloroplast envelope membrane protein [Sphagnum aongstroemii]
MKSYWAQFYCWLSNTPYRSLERAYEASKRIRYIKKDYMSYKDMVSYPRRFWQAMLLYMNTKLNNYIFIIYWSLSECKISLYLLNLPNNLLFIITKTFPFLFSKKAKAIGGFISFAHSKQQSLIFPQFHRREVWNNSSNFFSLFLSNSLERIMRKTNKREIQDKFDYANNLKKKPYFISNDSIKKYSRRIRRMNKKLAWIEATPNDLDTWKQYYSLSASSSEMGGTSENSSYFFNSKNSKDSVVTATAYESIGLVPRSITRTLSGFQTELTGQSSSLVLQEFRVAKYQALASLQYMGCLLLLPWGLSILIKEWFLEPWVKLWWNTGQFHIFINSFQEEIALKRLQEVEELVWLDKVMANSSEIQSQDLDIEIHEKTIQLVETYNEHSIQTILQLLTDTICFATLSASFLLGKERLAILNSWIQELFYSLNDTMKAFFILLLTDLCIGFHSPHGWEIVIGSFLEHLGFARNKHIISCFVSTFPVILDTVLKYWIFRHLNRISPSIVATYHTMNE